MLSRLHWLRLNSQYVNMTIQEHIHKSFSYKKAMRSLTFCLQWAQVIEKNLNSLTLNKIWELIELSKECLSITFKWVFKVKYTFSSLIECFKAHLVTRGFSQQYAIDYKESFALTLCFNSLCMLLTVTAHKDLHINQMNVVSAYLTDELKEEIYIKPSESLLYIENRTRKIICYLIKRLYDLKQFRRVWNNVSDHSKIFLIYETFWR